MSHEIKDVLPVVHMPYTDDLLIDSTTLAKQVDYLFETGAHGFCLALVSDLLRLTATERLLLPSELVKYAANRGPVIIGVGAESTAQARAFSRAAEDGGAAAVMAIPPISRSLGESELRAYFEALLEEIKIPVIIQDASSYVGSPMSIEFQASLFADHGNRILFKPEASPLGPCISAIRDRTNGKAAIYEGSGGLLLIDSFHRGIKGTIPGVELLDGTTALWQALIDGDHERAYRIYFPICALCTLQLQGGLDSFIVVERYLMHKRGLFPNQVHRGPLSYFLDPETCAEIDRLYELLQEALQ